MRTDSSARLNGGRAANTAQRRADWGRERPRQQPLVVRADPARVDVEVVVHAVVGKPGCRGPGAARMRVPREPAGIDRLPGEHDDASTMRTALVPPLSRSGSPE